MSWRALHFRVLLDELQSSLQWLWSLQPHSAPQETLYWPDIQIQLHTSLNFDCSWLHRIVSDRIWLLLSYVWNQPSRIPVPLFLWDAWWPDAVGTQFGREHMENLASLAPAWSYPCHPNIIKYLIWIILKTKVKSNCQGEMAKWLCLGIAIFLGPVLLW